MKKFLSYVFTFVLLFVIAAATTVSVTYFNDGGTKLRPITNVDGEGSNASLFSGILSSFENNKQFNFQGDITLEGEEESLPVLLYVNVDIADTNNIKVEGFVKLVNEDKENLIEFGYYNSTIYLSYNNINIKLTTKTIEDLVEEVTKLIPKAEEPEGEEQEGLLDSLMPQIMASLNDMTEVDLENGDKQVELNIEGLASVVAVTSSEDMPKSVKLETAKYKGYKVNADIDIEFNENIVISNPETIQDKEFFDVNTLYQVVKNTAMLSDVGADISLTVKDGSAVNKIGFNLLANIYDGNFSVDLYENTYGFMDKANLTYFNQNLYVGANDGVKLLLSKALIDDVKACVETLLNQYVPEFVELSNHDISNEITNKLKLLTKEDVLNYLSYIKDINLSEAGLTVELSGELLGLANNLVIELGFENNAISNLSVKGLIVDGKEIEFEATISETQEKVAVINPEEYLDVYEVYLANKNYYNTTALEVRFDAEILSGKLAGNSATGAIKFDLSKAYVELNAQILGDLNLTLSAYMFGETGYISVNDIKVKASKTQIVEFLDEYGLTDMLNSQKEQYIRLVTDKLSNLSSNYDIEDILDTIKDVQINSNEISLTMDGSLFGLDSNICAKVHLVDYIVSLIELKDVDLEGSVVSARVEVVNNAVTEAEIDKASYLDVLTVLENTKNLSSVTEGSVYANAVVDKGDETYNAYLEFSGSLNREFLSLYFGLSGSLQLSASVVYVDDVCYLQVDENFVSVSKETITQLLNFTIGDDMPTLDSLDTLDISGKIKTFIGSLSLADLAKVKGVVVNSNYISITLDSSLFGLNGNVLLRVTLEDNLPKQVELINLKVEDMSINLSLVLSLSATKKPTVDNSNYLSVEKLINGLEKFTSLDNINLEANVKVYSQEDDQYLFGLNALLGSFLVNGEVNASLVTSVLMGDNTLNLNLAYLRNTIFAEFNGLKVKLEKDNLVESVHIILDLLGKDQNSYDNLLYSLIGLLENGNVLELVSGLNIDKVNLDNVSGLKNVSLETVFELLKGVRLNASEIALTVKGELFGIAGNIDVLVTLDNSVIKQININKLCVGDKYIDVTLNVDGDNVADWSVSKDEETNYIDIYQLAKVARATYNTLANGAISGNFTLKFEYMNEINIVNVEYGIKLVENEVVAYLKTNFKGLDVNVYYIDGTFYLDIVGLKVYVAFSELREVVDFLNTEFGLNMDIDLSVVDGVMGQVSNSSLKIEELVAKLSQVKLDFVKEVVFGEYSMEAIFTNGFSVFVNYHDMVEQVIFKTNDIMVELNCDSFDDFLLSQVNTKEYQHYSALIDTYYAVKSTVMAKQYNLLAGVEVYEASVLKYDITASMALDIVNALNLNAHVNIEGKSQLNVNVAFEDDVLYFDYDNLKLCINQLNLKEILVIVLEALGVDASKVGFLADIAENMELDTDNLASIMPNIDFGNPLNMLKIIKTMSIEENKLELVLNGNMIADSASDMTLVVTTNETGVESLDLLNIYTGSGTESFNLHITLGEYVGVETVPNKESYIDISESSSLLKAFVNSSNLNDFSISGTINVVASVIGIDINMDVPITMQIKMVDGKPEVYAVMDIPVIGSNVPGFTGINVNNDVPYKGGDTSVKSRRLEIMYYDGYVYFYRKDVVKQTVFATRTYEKKLKISYQELLDDPMTYLMQYGFGFSDTIMKEINSAMEKSQNRTSPIDYSNILLGYKKVASDQHQIILNLAEIANNDQLGTATINIYTINNSQTKNKDYLYKVAFDIYMPIASAFELNLKTDDLSLVNIGQEVDMSSMYEYVNAYTYKENQQYEASNGSWALASEKTYIINFVDSMGNSVDTIEETVNSEIALPELESIVVDDGITRKTYTFVGWYTSETCEESTKYTSTVMTRGDKTLYAGWREETINYVTLTFDSMGGETVESITQLEQSEIVLPSLGNKIVIDGQTKITYAFAGWFVDSGLSDRFEENLMPSENITLYAGWTEVERYVAYLLSVYDDNKLVYSEYVGEGSEIAITGTKIDSYTKFYLDSGYASEYAVSTMSSEDLTLYVRNRYALTIVSEYGNAYNNVEYHYQGEALTIPSQASYVVDNGVTRTTYTFNGWENEVSYMPNSDVTMTANWDVEVKHYYTVTFHLDWYTPTGWASQGIITQSATSVANDNKLVVLEGETVDLSQYVSTLKAKYTKISPEKTFKSTSWSTTKPGALSTNVTSIATITNIAQNYDVYAVWKVQ